MTQDEKIKFITYFLLENSKALEFFKELIGNLIPEPPKETWLVKIYPLESEFLAEVYLRDADYFDAYGEPKGYRSLSNQKTSSGRLGG